MPDAGKRSTGSADKEIGRQGIIRVKVFFYDFLDVFAKNPDSVLSTLSLWQ